MGTSFRRLIAAEWLSNLGDGIALAAGPLLIAGQTRNPALVALATILQRVPQFLFALYAGWLADRTDRRRMIVVANGLRAVVLATLAVVILTGAVNVAVVLVALFLLGTSETFVDTTSGALLPMIVKPADLGVANARRIFGRRALNDLIGPPIGAWLIVVGLAVPFMAQAAVVALAAVLVWRIGSSRPAMVSATGGVRADTAAGLRWVWANPPMRTLTLAIVLFNVTFGAVWPLLVLYADERLGLGEVGFGLLFSSAAVGGIVGAVAYARLERTFSLGSLLKAGLLIETLVHLGLLLSTSAAVSMAILFAFGAHATVWGTTSTTVRQRAVPDDLQGRVGGVYAVGVFGGLVVGGAVGAAIAGVWGILAPFWFAFVGSAVLLVALWRELALVAHAEELVAA